MDLPSSLPKDRILILDTETTGLAAADHRLIEVGIVEYRNRRPSGMVFHVYLNPQRDIDPEATRIHGKTQEMLQEMPLFSDVAGDLIDFIRGTEIVIHNAEFDVGFLDAELRRCGRDEKLGDLCRITDSLKIARLMYPGQKVTLDALCDRMGVSREHRTLHGALRDASLLGEVFMAMTAGQRGLDFAVSVPGRPLDDFDRFLEACKALEPAGVRPPDPDEMTRHLARMKAIYKKCGTPVWDLSDAVHAEPTTSGPDRPGSMA